MYRVAIFLAFLAWPALAAAQQDSCYELLAPPASAAAGRLVLLNICSGHAWELTRTGGSLAWIRMSIADEAQALAYPRLKDIR